MALAGIISEFWRHHIEKIGLLIALYFKENVTFFQYIIATKLQPKHIETIFLYQ
jgi:hypothetical protein